MVTYIKILILILSLVSGYGSFADSAVITKTLEDKKHISFFAQNDFKWKQKKKGYVSIQLAPHFLISQDFTFSLLATGIHFVVGLNPNHNIVAGINQGTDDKRIGFFYNGRDIDRSYFAIDLGYEYLWSNEGLWTPGLSFNFLIGEAKSKDRRIIQELEKVQKELSELGSTIDRLNLHREENNIEGKQDSKVDKASLMKPLGTKLDLKEKEYDLYYRSSLAIGLNIGVFVKMKVSKKINILLKTGISNGLVPIKHFNEFLDSPMFYITMQAQYYF